MKSSKGSSLLLVVISVAVVAMVIGGVVSAVLTEKRMNNRHRLWIQARNVAESVVDSGLSQLIVRFQETEAFPSDALDKDRDPLVLTDEFFEFFGQPDSSGFSVVLPDRDEYDPAADYNSYPTEIVGGVIPVAESVFINPRDPANADDEFRGHSVVAQAVQVLGRATVRDASGIEQQAFATASLIVRDAPLFAHAIFYNLKLEIAPGPAMDIMGKVHANGDIYYMIASDKNHLNFHSMFSTPANIHYGRDPLSGKSTLNDTNVFFTSGKDPISGDSILVSYKINGKPMDSDMASFREATAKQFNYWVQSGEHGMGAHNVIAMEPYVADDPATEEKNDDLNYAYQMIMPTQDSKPGSATALEIEKQKFAYKAGLTIEIDPDSGAVQSVYTYERSGKDIAYDGDTPRRIYLDLPEVVLPDKSKKPETKPIVEIKKDAFEDSRENRLMNIVDIDMGRLKKAVESADIATISKDDLKDAKVKDPEAMLKEAKDLINAWRKDPRDWWNGVVYVKFPYADGSKPGKDGVQLADKGWAVRLHNAEQIPNPDFARENGIYGTTVATNAPMYLKGNYNADGHWSEAADDEFEPDLGNRDLYNPTRVYPEAAAALAADAVTILSDDWVDENSAEELKKRRVKHHTEVSAAIISGIVPSGKYGEKSYSGGVENFPRFLEDWKGKDFVYRGSIVCLYESELATGLWEKASYWAPVRKWGFNSMFGAGIYPPGMPLLRTFKRVDFKWLNRAEYEAELAAIQSALNPDED